MVNALGCLPKIIALKPTRKLVGELENLSQVSLPLWPDDVVELGKPCQRRHLPLVCKPVRIWSPSLKCGQQQRNHGTCECELPCTPQLQETKSPLFALDFFPSLSLIVDCDRTPVPNHIVE